PLASDGRATGLVGRPRLQADLGDTADGRQRLAAKTQRVDAEEVVQVLQFAGGVAGEGQRQVLGSNTTTIIHNLDEVAAAAGHFHIDAHAAGVDGVFQQFLDDAGGPLDDFAGGYLIDERDR